LEKGGLSLGARTYVTLIKGKKDLELRPFAEKERIGGGGGVVWGGGGGGGVCGGGGGGNFGRKTTNTQSREEKGVSRVTTKRGRGSNPSVVLGKKNAVRMGPVGSRGNGGIILQKKGRRGVKFDRRGEKKGKDAF